MEGGLSHGMERPLACAVVTPLGLFLFFVFFRALYTMQLKKDYLEQGALADTADLVVLGAYFD